ncbi:class I SAM-dependent methyltransferase [uncultured Maritalea sp.]|jgi:SAM-dependent methyltransferase|uniref:class I SAM-dependent methyltransferase n=1 Tax=uncultured Maritalea sp. TaxID=757249 RepID=UPI0026065D98|nr:class I SAM-dependent methyltransferase [uncultured Maritalea sp.]
MSYDPKTFQFYADNAQEYASRRTKPSKTLTSFLEALPNAGRVLELGCGAGLEAQHMQSQGLDVTATEGNPELAKFAIERLGDRVKIMRFDELSDIGLYDGIWANMCLLHAPWDELDLIIKKIHTALKPGGLLMASFKSGEGAGRDKLDRYYNLPTKKMLNDKFSGAAAWQRCEVIEKPGGIGHDGTLYEVLFVIANR